MATITIGRVLNASADSVLAQQGSPPWTVSDIARLIPSAYDYMALSYTSGLITTVVYKSGGAGGTTVATLTIGYDGNGNITSVART